MNFKINVSQRDIDKVLNYISNYNHTVNNGTVYLDKNFYTGLSPMSVAKINQVINAMEAEGIIIKHKPAIQPPCPSLNLTNIAFVYRLRKRRDNLRFAIPTVVSIIAVLKAFDKEFLLLWALIKQLMK